jgi:hypothetical protein
MTMLGVSWPPVAQVDVDDAIGTMNPAFAFAFAVTWSCSGRDVSSAASATIYADRS